MWAGVGGRHGQQLPAQVDVDVGWWVVAWVGRVEHPKARQDVQASGQPPGLVLTRVRGE